MSTSAHTEGPVELTEQRLVARGSWTVTDAAQLHIQLNAFLTAFDDSVEITTIDCSLVTAIDLAGVQLLFALQQQIPGRPTFVFADNVAVTECFKLSGV